MGYSGMNFLNQWVEKTSIFLGRRNYAQSQGTPGQSLAKSSVLHLSSETLLLLTSKKTTSLLRALNPIAFPSLQCSLHVVDVFSAQFFPEQLPWPGRCTWLPFSFLSPYDPTALSLIYQICHSLSPSWSHLQSTIPQSLPYSFSILAPASLSPE